MNTLRFLSLLCAALYATSIAASEEYPPSALITHPSLDKPDKIKLLNIEHFKHKQHIRRLEEQLSLTANKQLPILETRVKTLEIQVQRLMAAFQHQNESLRKDREENSVMGRVWNLTEQALPIIAGCILFPK